jgi:DNA-binding Lrp family transcriptional regulator
MVTAWLLITVKAGADEEVVEKLRKIENVDEVFEIYGAYDIIAKIEAETDEKLKKLIKSDIEKLANIKSVTPITVKSREK